MEPNALVHVRFTRPERRRGTVPTSIALALLLAGCAGSEQSRLSQRQPSLRVADAALAAGAPEVALRVADLTLAREPRNVLALITKGDALYSMSERDMARTAYRAAVAVDPTAAAAQLGLGRTLIRSDPGAAEAAFMAVTAREPNNVAALSDLGVARDMQGHHAMAQDAYRQALVVGPEAAEVKVNLGLSLALSGNKDAALGVLREVAEQPGAAQDRRKELAGALALAGDEAGARRVLNETPAQLVANIPPAPSHGTEIPAPPPAAHQAVVASKPLGEGLPREEATVAAKATLMPAAVHPLTDLAFVTPAILTAPVVAVARESELMPPEVKRPAPSAHPDAETSVPSPAATETTAASDAPDMLALVAKPGAPELSRMPERAAYVQLASLHSADDAAYEWRRLSRRMPDLMGGHEPTIKQAEARGQTYWVLRTFGYGSLNEAKAMCARMLEAVGLRCWARTTS